MCFLAYLYKQMLVKQLAQHAVVHVAQLFGPWLLLVGQLHLQHAWVLV
jgi:hypothetical protein